MSSALEIGNSKYKNNIYSVYHRDKHSSADKPETIVRTGADQVRTILNIDLRYFLNPDTYLTFGVVDIIKHTWMNNYESFIINMQ